MTITADQYPFTGGSAPLISQIPPKYLTAGKAEGLRCLAESAELRKQAEWSIFHEAMSLRATSTPRAMRAV